MNDEELCAEAQRELPVLEDFVFRIGQQHRCEPNIGGLFSLARSRGIPLASVLRAAASPTSAEMREIIDIPPVNSGPLFGTVAQRMLDQRRDNVLSSRDELHLEYDQDHASYCGWAAQQQMLARRT